MQTLCLATRDFNVISEERFHVLQLRAVHVFFSGFEE